MLPVVNNGDNDSRFRNRSARVLPEDGKKKKKKKDDCVRIFADGAYWETLFPLEEVVDEPLYPTFKIQELQLSMKRMHHLFQ